MKLQNYINGNWVKGQGEGIPMFDAVTGEIIGFSSTEGLDIPAVLEYGRKNGNTLRKMTFQERGNMIKSLALYLNKRKEAFYEISYRTGATRVDSWIDIEGGFGNLFANASLRKLFPNQPFDVEGDAIDLSKGGRFMAHHILVPKQGVAVHINAFNFPIWGMLEKCACNWMAGMPAVVLPAPQTAFLTEAVVREIIASGILPEGSLQLLSGKTTSILDTVNSQDVVTFTGSAHTGKILKNNPRLLEESVPFTMEADSLNACVLGKDATPGTAEFDIFIKEVVKEITVKTGQKCTAVRRIIVPENLIEEVLDLEELIDNEDNYKQLLLIYYQKVFRLTPEYVSLSVEGPPNHRIYTLGVLDKYSNVICKASGKSKQEAEQLVSKYALEYYGAIKENKKN
jgi:oxepin-CoA hydrolase/3-oxo-5,6-dehydrosuberyl-CoA semialdehyde dehydrogenase